MSNPLNLIDSIDINFEASGDNLSGTVNAGTGANSLVRLDTNGRLPAIDGSQLTNLPASQGLFTPTLLAKLNGIEAGATADQSAAEVPFTAQGGVTATNVQAAIVQAAGMGGSGGGTDDQTATEVPFTPAGGVAATDVQAAIVEVAGDIPTATSELTNDSNFVVDANYVHTDNNFTDADESKLDGIETGATGDQSANEVPFSPAGGITATNVQNAIEQAATMGGGGGGGVTLPVDDSTALVRDPADNTKQARLDVEAVATGTTRVITVPDQDVDLTPSGTFASQSHVNSTDGHPMATGSAAGFMSSADKTKLDGVESGATADQSGPEIKAAYEVQPNAFTDDQFTKLAGIETGATADQSAAEVPFTPQSGIAANNVEGAILEAAAMGGGVSLPVDDTTALVQDPADNTRQTRIDTGAVATGTTRTITMPDADVDLTSGTAAGNLVRLDSQGRLPPVNGSQLTGISGGGGGGFGNVVTLTQSATQTIDASAGTAFVVAVSANTTFQFSNVPAGDVQLTLYLTISNGAEIALPSHYSPSGSPLSFSDGTYIVSVRSHNAASTLFVNIESGSRFSETLAPFSLSSASYDNATLSVSTQDASPQGVAFSADGSKAFIVGFISDSIHQYSLPTPFVLTGGTYDNVSLSVSAQDGQPRGVAFSTDGMKLFMVGSSSDSVHQYSLNNAFRLTGASYDNVSLSVSAQDGSPQEVAFSSDGSKMFVLGLVSRSVHQYSLPTPFVLTGGTYDNVSLSVASEETGPSGMAFSSSGSEIFIVGSSADSVFQYALQTQFILAGAAYSGVSLSVASEDNSPTGLAASSDGARMYMVGSATDAIYQYSSG